MSSTLSLSKPSSSFFRFLPKYEPETIYPPSGNTTPFHIPTELFSSALDTKVPVTIALLYSVTVSLLNVYNYRHQYQPWSISKTKIFTIFVILHNIILTFYSGWTFLGMWGTLKRSVISPYGHNGLVGTVDSLCKIHGPRGLGEAVIYNTTISQWTPQSHSLSLDGSRSIELSSPGRIWSEGLAFYGWLFYISKFYEVIDTLIIVAKGKKSGILQTFHHAGAMLCMWSGIRFMSPPIWMFVFINSAIHTLMYLYFSLVAFKLPVSQLLKKVLTKLQILQLLIGTLYAAIHSFISYSYLSETPFVETMLDNSVSTTASPVSSFSSTPTSIADMIKKLLVSSLGQPDTAAHVKVETPKYVESVRYRIERKNATCLDTSGQNFAIWLNVIYLMPLTFLFLRFYVNSYYRRSTKEKKGKAEIKFKKIPSDEQDSCQTAEK